MIGEHTIRFLLGRLLAVLKPSVALMFSLLPTICQLVVDAVPPLRKPFPYSLAKVTSEDVRS